MTESCVEVVILVKESHLGNLSEIVDSCRSVGLFSERTLDTIGIITGKIDSTKIPDLKNIDGVLHVEVSQVVQALDGENNEQT